MRVGKSECALCPNPILNSLRVLGFMLMIFVIIWICIWFNIRKKTESKASMINRIATNYLHSITASVSFNLKFPSLLINVMNPLSRIGESSDTFFSFDCFIEDLKLNVFSDSEYIIKSFLPLFMPIVFIGVFMTIFGLVKVINRNSNFQRNILMVIITVLFFFHPTLTGKAIAFFRCINIHGTPRKVNDLEIKCWETAHMAWAFGVGVPIIIFWSIGIPLFGVIFILKNRKNLHEDHFSSKYLILYQGLKPNRAYWEMINIIRKVVLLMINVFIPDDQIFYKVIIWFLFLFSYLRV